MTDIGKAVGLSSTFSVSHRLAALEKKGVIRKDTPAARTHWLGNRSTTRTPLPARYPATAHVPLLGGDRAANSDPPEQDVADVLELPHRLVDGGGLFALVGLGQVGVLVGMLRWQVGHAPAQAASSS
ncbi:LexA family protein [Streptomyces sp. NPDC056061]|uniref:LexA family protein n=1 Tax=Streptomyces sp. NPDC056061 TaxID=3345700 RepID=UPI0035DD4CBD